MAGFEGGGGVKEVFEGGKGVAGFEGGRGVREGEGGAEGWG